MESAKLIADLTVFFIQTVKSVIEAVGRKLYYATQAAHDAFGYRVATVAARAGADLAREIVFIGDGAKWVWGLCEREFGRFGRKLVEVLDWYHAVEHLWEASRAFFGEASDLVTPWVKAREGELHDGKTDAVIAAVRALAEERGAAPEGADESDPRVVLWRNVGCFEENAPRMKYPEYRARGIPMGSGVVESACKHVVAGRLKGPGMRWDEPGAEAILHLRSLELNGRWDAFWERDPNSCTHPGVTSCPRGQGPQYRSANERISQPANQRR